MASIAAAEVGKAMMEAVEKGEMAKITTIAPKKGYSIRTAQSGKIQKTKTYIKTTYPLVARIEEERQRAIEALPKLIGKAKYRDAIDAIDKLTKNHQLLTGKATENNATHLYVHFIDDKDNADPERVQTALR